MIDQNLKDNISDALHRSGYLFESEITSKLRSIGYFVESNQLILDEETGKSRELDLLAEKPLYASEEIITKVRFIFELKNNPFPVVLLTKVDETPYLSFTEVLKDKIDFRDQFPNYTFQNPLVYKKEDTIYSQYCTFQEKKGKAKELMAWHPESFHLGLKKLVKFCDDQLEFDGFKYCPESVKFRTFLYLPIVLLKGKLLVLESESPIQMKEVKTATLLYNYHKEDYPSSAFIYFVTEDGLEEFLKQFTEFEKKIITEYLKQIKGSA